MTTKKYKNLEVNIEDKLCVLTISRENQLNALNKELLTELRDFFEHAHEETIQGIIITGKGEKAFVAGADIKEMADLTSEQATQLSYLGQQVTLAIEECRVPVIAAVNGYALGGGLELALACDFIYASKNSKFALPEVSLGLIPGFGGTQRLSRVVGRNAAKELIYTGRVIDASEALAFGLVLGLEENRESLLKLCREKMTAIFKNSLFAVAEAKTVMNLCADSPIAEGLELEKQRFGNIFTSHDMKEGTQAFINKRKPDFKGR